MGQLVAFCCLCPQSTAHLSPSFPQAFSLLDTTNYSWRAAYAPFSISQVLTLPFKTLQTHTWVYNSTYSSCIPPTPSLPIDEALGPVHTLLWRSKQRGLFLYSQLQACWAAGGKVAAAAALFKAMLQPWLCVMQTREQSWDQLVGSRENFPGLQAILFSTYTESCCPAVVSISFKIGRW